VFANLSGIPNEYPLKQIRGARDHFRVMANLAFVTRFFNIARGSEALAEKHRPNFLFFVLRRVRWNITRRQSFCRLRCVGWGALGLFWARLAIAARPVRLAGRQALALAEGWGYTARACIWYKGTRIVGG